MTDALASELTSLFRAVPFDPLADDRFDALARRAFTRQFEGSPPYRAFCEGRQRTPEAVRHWTEIPTVPVRAFQDGSLARGEGIVRVFRTSGTTAGRRGEHALSAGALDLYRAAMVPTFRHFLLPELEREPAGARTGLLPIVLAPAAEEIPESSLSYMLDGVLEALFATAPRRVFGPGGLDGVAWRAALAEAEREGRAACLLGTSLAFHAALEWLERRDESFRLPTGSRAMHTGGTKTSGLVLSPRELRARASSRLGIEPQAFVAEYGMTEACSQFYEAEWREAFESEGSCEFLEREESDRRFLVGPPWARAVVCDLETLEPAPPGTLGVVRLVDLANLLTLSFLQTEDLAVAREGVAGPGSGAFALAGRAEGAEARGCSLTAEEWSRHAGAAP